MALVAELSEGIADEFREKKLSKIQRTFVKASDAAEAKIKGRTTSCELFWCLFLALILFLYSINLMD